MKDEFVAFTKKHRPLYVMMRCLQRMRSEEFFKFLMAYCEGSSGRNVIMIDHPGEQCPDTLIYYSTLGVGSDCFSGFFADLRQQMERLYFAERMGMIPVVHWGELMQVYYDAGMDSETKNVFEYYFKPVSDIPWQEIGKYANVVYGRPADAGCFVHLATGSGKSYLAGVDDIELLGQIYKKYIHPNEKTVAYLKENLKGIFQDGKKTLGVHVRGTDFNLGLKGHPVAVPPQESLDKTKELFAAGDYEQIFLATDDTAALELFQEAFGSKLCYFDDALRGSGTMCAHGMVSDRPLHRYKLGLEVIRDAYALACCDSLIAGMSQVSFGARFINYALDRKYSELVIMNKGLEAKNGPNAAKEVWKIKRQIRESQKE